MVQVTKAASAAASRRSRILVLSWQEPGAFGDAGAVTTDDNAVAARVRVLRIYGSRRKYYNEEKASTRDSIPCRRRSLG